MKRSELDALVVQLDAAVGCTFVLERWRDVYPNVDLRAPFNYRLRVHSEPGRFVAHGRWFRPSELAAHISAMLETMALHRSQWISAVAPCASECALCGREMTAFLAPCRCWEKSRRDGLLPATARERIRPKNTTADILHPSSAS